MDGRFQGFLLAVLIGALCRQSRADKTAIGVAAENLNSKCTNCASKYTSFPSLQTAQEQCASSQEFTVCVQGDSTCNSIPEVLTFNSLCTIGVAAENLNKSCTNTKCAANYTIFTTLPTAQAQCAPTQNFTVCVQDESACNSQPQFNIFIDLCKTIYTTPSTTATTPTTTTPPTPTTSPPGNKNPLHKDTDTETTPAGNSTTPSMASFHRASAILLLLVAFVTFLR